MEQFIQQFLTGKLILLKKMAASDLERFAKDGDVERSLDEALRSKAAARFRRFDMSGRQRVLFAEAKGHRFRMGILCHLLAKERLIAVIKQHALF